MVGDTQETESDIGRSSVSHDRSLVAGGLCELDEVHPAREVSVAPLTSVVTPPHGCSSSFEEGQPPTISGRE